VRKSINLLRRAAAAPAAAATTDPTVASEIPACRVTSTPYLGVCACANRRQPLALKGMMTCVRSVGHADAVAGINSGAPLRSICLRGLNTVANAANNKLIRCVRDLGVLF
jgi:hypothetical protein